MEEAIKKAIDEGYKLLGWEAHKDYVECDHGLSQEKRDIEMRRLNLYAINSIVLDPLFWQALGKAEGWDRGIETCQIPNTCSYHSSWKRHWHCFIDHLAEGKDADSFFKELLKVK